MRKGLLVALLGGSLLLGGCLETVLPAGEPGPYDGRWIGRISLSYGKRSCLRRASFQGTVEGGYLQAITRHNDQDMQFVGRVDEGGSLENGDVRTHRFDRDTAFGGQFSDSDAKGRWKTDDCEGEWELRRVSRSVE